MEAFLGVDSHKESMWVSVVDRLGKELESATTANDGRGFKKIERIAHRFGAVRVGVEGSGSFGMALVQHLVAAGIVVKEVPAQLVERNRRRLARGKSDDLDALLIARVVARDANLPDPPLAGAALDLKALVDQRKQLTEEATRHRNRAHAILSQMRPGYSAAVPRLVGMKNITAARELMKADLGVRAEILRDALERLQELESAAAAIKKQIDCLVKKTGTTLTEIAGVGPITAGRILGEVRDVHRLAGQGEFGMLTGTAPVPASSGKTDRMRLNRGGNRQLNNALHMIALAQSRMNPEARAYLTRKRAEGKSGKEAMRCLKRHLARVIYRRLLADQPRLVLT